MSQSSHTILSPSIQHMMCDAKTVWLKSRFTLHTVEQMPSSEIYALIHRLLDLTGNHPSLSHEIEHLCPSLSEFVSSSNHLADGIRVVLGVDNHNDNISEKEIEKAAASSGSHGGVNSHNEGSNGDAVAQDTNVHHRGSVKRNVQMAPRICKQRGQSSKLLLTTVPSISAPRQRPFCKTCTNGVDSQYLSRNSVWNYPYRSIRWAELDHHRNLSFSDILNGGSYIKLDSSPGPDIFKIQLRPVVLDHQHYNITEELDDVSAHLDTYSDRSIISKSLANTLQRAGLADYDRYPTDPVIWGKEELTCLRVLTVAFLASSLTGAGGSFVLQMQVVPDDQMPLRGLIVGKKEIAFHDLLRFVQYDLTVGNPDRLQQWKYDLFIHAAMMC